MMTIQPTISTSYTTFQSKVTVPEEQKSAGRPSESRESSKTLAASLAALAITGTAAVLLGKRSKLTYEEALKKSGVEIKDGVAVLIDSGERYTGTIKRNVQAFGRKRETVNFTDGIITEKVYHNISGAELEGEFFKNGIKRIKVTRDMTKDELYIRYTYNSNGDMICRTSCSNIPKNKFEAARDIVKNL